MKKKWISILLAVLMVVSLLPLSALAAEGENSNVNPSTGREPGPKGDSDVALMVYSEMISDAAKYTFLRTNSLSAEADKILNLISDGKTGTLIQDVLAGKNDVTAATLLYAAGIIYNNLGGNQVYASEQELVDALNQYLYAYGRTAQNLLMFGNQVALKAKSVVTCEITPDWTFYTATTSPRANIALRLKALVEGFASSMDTTGDNAVTAFFKDAAENIAEAIDTTNHIADQVEEVKEAVQEAVSEAVTNAVKSAVGVIIGVLFRKWH